MAMNSAAYVALLTALPSHESHPGGMLLDDPAWSAREAPLTLEALRRAERIVVCNALRGAVDAILHDEAGEDSA